MHLLADTQHIWHRVENGLRPCKEWAEIAQALGGGEDVLIDVNGFSPHKPRLVDWRFFLSRKHPDFGQVPISSFGNYGCGTHKEAIMVAASMVSRGCWDASIPESWEQFYKALVAGKKIVVDLSKLEEPVGWLKIYEAIADYVRLGTLASYLQTLSIFNEVLNPEQRLITTTLNWNHESALEYVQVRDENIPYISRHLRVQPELLDDETLSLAVLESLDSEFFILEKAGEGTW